MLTLVLALLAVTPSPVSADLKTASITAASAPASSPATLPGKGLAGHDLLYCGEYDFTHDQQTMHLVRGGREVWSYAIPFHILLNDWADGQEFGDCALKSNGNIVFTTRFGAREVTIHGKTIWEFQATLQHTEIHSLQVIDDEHILLAQNGNPARVLLINTRADKIEKILILPTGNPSYEHGQLRRVRLTPQGTILAAQMDLNRVVEYDWSGKVLWSVDAPEPWSAIRLTNGNTLIGGNVYGYVREVDPAGKTVWELTRADLPGYTIGHIQDVVRLENGDTVFANWVAGHTPPADWPRTSQLIEVTPDKKVIWALRSWTLPNLGPASGFEILDPSDKH